MGWRNPPLDWIGLFSPLQPSAAAAEKWEVLQVRVILVLKGDLEIFGSKSVTF